MNSFNGVKVFSATMMHDRAELGERVTEWMREHPSIKVVDVVITQSSDHAFHCIAITVFYNETMTPPRKLKSIDPCQHEWSVDEQGTQRCTGCGESRGPATKSRRLDFTRKGSKP